jgi:hypothetical protein
VLFISVPFPEFELGSPNVERLVCSEPGSDGDRAGSSGSHIASRRPVLEDGPDAWRHVRAELHGRRAAQSFSGEFRLSPMTSKRFLCDAKANETERWRSAVAYVIAETGNENLHVVAAHRSRNADVPSDSDGVWWDWLTSEAG